MAWSLSSARYACSVLLLWLLSLASTTSTFEMTMNGDNVGNGYRLSSLQGQILQSKGIKFTTGHAIPFAEPSEDKGKTTSLNFGWNYDFH
jgi:hypothetical protein